MAETSNNGTEAASRAGPSPCGSEGERLTVLYDETCSFCRRCRDWLLGQRCFFELELLAAGSPIARERYGSLPWLGRELVVVDQDGRAWVGPAAFLTCLWATFGTAHGPIDSPSPDWPRSPSGSSGWCRNDGTGGARGWGETIRNAHGATRTGCGGRTVRPARGRR